MTDNTHAGWQGRHDNPTGTATLSAGGKTVQIHLQCFEDYMAVLEIIRLSRKDALECQTDYLRGALNRMLDQR